jgi:hypothetical protein
MAITVIGSGGVIVDAGEKARAGLHVQRVPKQGNWYSYSGFTGTIGAALAANSELLQFRFLSGTKTKCEVHSVTVDGVAPVAVATALGPMGFALFPARAWSVAGSGGTRISVAGDNLQMETDAPNSQLSDLGIATTGALTVGTKTLDANAQGLVLFGVGTGAVTVAQNLSLLGATLLFDAEKRGGMPLSFANQEGFAVRTTHIGVAGLTYVVGFTVVWCEVAAT